MSIAMDVICPEDLKTSFSDIGGMEKEIDVILDNVILPFKFWQEEFDRKAAVELQRLKTSSGEINPNPSIPTSAVEVDMSNIECHVPGGMLMYGKPGTGKTMLAKAIAKEAEASFIGVKSGTILDKYVGESDKLVTAIFSLAQKIAPTVIFIDEIDTLLRKREALQSSSANSLGSMLGTLMAEWDGLNSDGKAPVIVLGATNRPMDIDSAFLRRMPLTIQTKAPDYTSRIDILTKMLQNEALSDDVNVELIAASIDGFTGSDIREICRLASISRMKAVLKEKKLRSAGAEGGAVQPGEKGGTRPLFQVDFDQAITKTIEDGQQQSEYSDELSFDDARDKIDLAKQWVRDAIARSKKQANGSGGGGGGGGSGYPGNGPAM
mmetsp:Transcript_36788/g.68426  ORF Transcript_36788/g.68426 Transcript_36788/m.68426 type:complete len:379 (-) Transcript_36788:150-1286(-)